MPAAIPPAIEVSGVTRRFGKLEAVKDLTFTAEQGRVTALVGPNGCGKSTLMLMLTALLAPNQGNIRVCGYDPLTQSEEVRRRIGWMPDQFGTWDNLTVREVLTTVGATYFLDRDDCRQRAEMLLELLDLSSLADESAHVLSRGQKQRLGLARALIHEPEVLVLDEPASGLDPASRRNLRRLVRQFAEQGGSVLISSHILAELEEMADAVVMMEHGTCVAQRQVRELAESSTLWRFSGLHEGMLREALSSLGAEPEKFVPIADSITGEAEAYVTVRDLRHAALLLQRLAEKDVQLVGSGPAHGRLESAFLKDSADREKGAL
ncbi:ABC transporter ATP-binding protein [Dermabacteraceae bacterium P13138]